MVEKLVNYLNMRAKFKSIEEKQKAEYILTILLEEFSKGVILFLIFAFVGWGLQFLLSMFIVMITRSFAGELHQNTSIRCFVHSFLFFSFIWYTESFSLGNNYAYLMLLFFIVLHLRTTDVRKARIYQQ